MKKFFSKLLLCSIAISPMMLNAQGSFTVTYGGGISDNASELIVVPGGYITAGTTTSFGAGNADVILSKFDPTGNILWSKTFGSTNRENITDIKLNSSNNIIGTAWMRADQTVIDDWGIFELDTNGTMIWDNYIGHSDPTHDDQIYGGIETSNADAYLWYGSTMDVGTGLQHIDCYLVKTDKTGNVIWANTYGSSSKSNEYIFDVKETADKGFICFATTVSFGAGLTDMYLIKVDSLGKQQWTKTIGGASEETATNIFVTPDKGYMFFGSMESYSSAGDTNIAMIRMDSLGNLIWAKTFGTTKNDAVGSVLYTSDGHYLIAGNTAAGPHGKSDALLIKVDSLGNILWSNTYGGAEIDAAQDIQPANDGGYVFSGISASYNTGIKTQGYLVKTDSIGYTDSCNAPIAIVLTTTTITPSIGSGGSDKALIYTDIIKTPVISPASLPPANYCCAAMLNLGSDKILCKGDLVTFDATLPGASSYNWYNGSTNTSITTDSTGKYWVDVTFKNCVRTDTVNVTVYDYPVIAANTSLDTICQGQSVSLGVSGASTYSWSPGNLSGSSVKVSPSTSVTYTVIGTNGTSCNDTTTVKVNVKPSPAVNLSVKNNICEGETVNITASGAGAYNWQPGGQSGSSISVVATTTATYTVVGTNPNGCTDTSTIVMTVIPLPTISVTGTKTICEGQSATLTASGAGSYTWMPGSQSGTSVNVSPTTTTTYTLTGTTSGCSDDTTVTLSVNPAPIAAFSAPNICLGDTLCFTNTSSGSVTSSAWNFGDNGTSVQSNPCHYYDTTGTFTVSLIVSTGLCTDTLTKTVNISTEQSSLTASSDSGIVPFNVQFSAISSTATTYYWNFGDGQTANGITPDHTFEEPGEYNVMLVTTNANGCTDTSYLLVEVIANSYITPPNVFTPNNDGVNDTYITDWQSIDDYKIKIYDRWGLIMYKGYNVEKGWDGNNMNGLPCSSGTYYYIIDAIGLDKVEYNLRGYLTLLRE